MSIGKRIEKLETRTGVGKREPKIWVIIQGESRPAGVEDGDLECTLLDHF